MRRAGLEDAPDIAVLNQHVHTLHAEAEPDDFYNTKPADAGPFFTSLLGDESHVLFVSEDATRTATGYVWAQDQRRPDNPFTKPTRTMYIHHVVVVPSARRQGAGRLLVSAIEDEARKRGIPRLALDHWSFNEQAETFFRSLGFEPYNVRMRRSLGGDVDGTR